MYKKLSTFLFLAIIVWNCSFGQSFKIIPLGVHGGLEENNLSSYLVTSTNNDHYIALDAGTLHAGLEKCSQKYFHKNPNKTLQENISAYFISHPHLDHLAGLIQNSPIDSKKTIYGLDFTIDAIEKHYFSWDTWANFGDIGEKPQLKKYHLQKMEIGKPILDSASQLTIEAFPLSHSNPGKSSAFLVKNNDNNTYLLYLGDTGTDSIEQHDNLSKLWQRIAPLITDHSLKAIMIEVSYPNKQSNKSLFGHLKPELLNQELSEFTKYTSKENIKNLPIIVTHIKPEENNEKTIKEELKKENPFQVKWIFPKQGKMIEL